MRSKSQYGRADLGTWIDGAYGMDHALEKMAAMLERVGTAKAAELAAELTDMDPEDEFAQEALDDATELLQEATEDGLAWEWEAGDLFLTTEEELE